MSWTIGLWGEIMQIIDWIKAIQSKQYNQQYGKAIKAMQLTI